MRTLTLQDTNDIAGGSAPGIDPAATGGADPAVPANGWHGRPIPIFRGPVWSEP